MCLEGLIIVIFVVTGIINFVMKAQKEQQGNARRQGNMQRQYPGRQYKQTIPTPQKNMQRKQGERISGSSESPKSNDVQGVGSLQPPQMYASDTEGIELESRHMRGSMKYVEPQKSSEGLGYKTKAVKKKKADAEKDAINSDFINSVEAHLDFDISAEDLMRSVVMAEVLGKPRAMRRNIR